jgi:hypothetical protein
MGRLGVFGLMGALTLIWLHDTSTAAVRATGSSTSLGVVQSFSRSASNSTRITIASTTATTAGDLLVMVVAVRRTSGLATVSGITDAGGNAWVRAASVQRVGADGELWYAANAASVIPTGGVTVKTTSAASIAATVVEVSGIAISAPLDVTAATSRSSSVPSTGTTAATNDASEIAVADIGWATSRTVSGQTAGYAPLPAAQSKVNGDAVGEQAATEVLSATGTQRYSAVLSASVPWTGVIATFKAAAVPPTPTPTTTPTISPTPSPSPSPTPIKHVVVIYQENHTFDNVLGNWCFTTLRCNGYNMAQPVTLKGGLQVTMQQSPDVVPNVLHSVPAQVTAIDGGLMDGWAGVAGCTATVTMSGSIPYGCLTYYTPAQIPNLIALANTFVVSDRTFSMADSPSWGGHVYAVAATQDNFNGEIPSVPSPAPPGWTQGPGWGCDSNLVTPWINPTTGVTSMQPSCIPDPALGGNGGAFEPTLAQYVPTIMDRLNQASLTWRLYTAPTGDADYVWAVCPSFAECLDTTQAQNMVPTQQVLSDAAAGTLPSYSLVLDGASTSSYGHVVQHNAMSMAVGDNWIGRSRLGLDGHLHHL